MAVGADRQVQVERVVLAVGEALEAVDDQRLLDEVRRPVAGEEQQGMAAEASGLADDGGVGAAGLAGDLAVAGAGEQAVEDRARAARGA